ncbi:hypothetical protein PHYPSEUDO_013495 [Phytophthora pseudosyringae]|uniref:Uncharacterized protein n=1 Tax=Phytophthora pseudosyringae TaxID=221518 RepID=A0A8T1WGR0_9STRA|nr:hypothetical protein PHYPSEUDO_013495 [Phytophthora pseudosyringae]
MACDEAAATIRQPCPDLRRAPRLGEAQSSPRPFLQPLRQYAPTRGKSPPRAPSRSSSFGVWAGRATPLTNERKLRREDGSQVLAAAGWSLGEAPSLSPAAACRQGPAAGSAGAGIAGGMRQRYQPSHGLRSFATVARFRRRCYM